MFTSFIRIPKERIAILIGPEGMTKRKIEKAGNLKIKVEQDGNITLMGEDNFDVFITTPVIRAIGRGFNPDKALTLLKENQNLEVLNIQDYVGKSKKKMYTTKARLIGTRGRAWKNIEHLTNTDISVYGKTVSIIGSMEDTYTARKAVEKLLQGSTHGKTYKFIEKVKEHSTK